MKPSSRGIFALILGTFFVSGVAGLLYQVVWTRYLALFLGHTSYAVIAVLAAFMGGLALGNAWLGARVDSLKRPLVFYAGLEIGIGVYAVLFPRYYELIEGLFLSVVRAAQPHGVVRLAIQFLFAGLTILLPTVLMGATLPALTRYVTRTLSELRGKVAALYAINSTGAVAGVLLADWWWIPSFGLEAVVYLGAAMSLSIGLVAYVVSVKGGELDEVAATPAPPTGKEETFTPLELRVALWGVGLSGFVAMLYEVAWTRLLGLALGSSTHAYSLMLATFISGIAVGGWLIYRWKRQADTLAAFGWAELALAGTLFVSLWFYDLLPYWFVQLAGILTRRPDVYPVYELLQGAVCFAVMFIPAVCLGMTLPLASRVATAEVARTGRSVGRVFAVNTLGTVLGAVLTGLVLLPVLGLAATLALGTGLSALVGLIVLAARSGSVRNVVWISLTVTAALTAVVQVTLGDRWSRAFVQGLFRQPSLPGSLEELRRAGDGLNMPFHRDGAGSTVAVLSYVDPQSNTTNLSLKVNGKADASTGEDMSTQLLAGHLPMFLRPDASEALVVGAGSGVTVGALVKHSTMRRVDLVEISPEVVHAARDLFAPHHGDALRNPKTAVHVEDAKTFLKTTSARYDVIVTEPSNPWMAGVAAVFSQEYYQDCRARLKPGGICAQWVQIYETDDRTFETVVATFGSVFPYLSLWQTASGDLLLIGAPEAFAPSLDAFAERMRAPGVAEDLRQIGMTRPVCVLSLQLIAFGDAFFTAPEGTQVHSDFNPVLEYRAQRAFFARGRADKPIRLSETSQPRPRTLLGEHLSAHPLTTADCEALATMFAKTGLPFLHAFRGVLYRWVGLDPGAVAAYRLLASFSTESPAPDGDAMRLVASKRLQTGDLLNDRTLLRKYGDMLLLSYRASRSAFFLAKMPELERVLEQLITADPANQRVHRLRLAEVLWDRGDEAKAREIFGEASNPDESKFGPVNFQMDTTVFRAVAGRLIDSDLRVGNLQRAAKLTQDLAAQGYLNPNSPARDDRLLMLTQRVQATLATALEAKRQAAAQ
jgi:spermidine synthase